MKLFSGDQSISKSLTAQRMFQNFKIKIVLIRSILFEFTDLLKYLIIFVIVIRRSRLEVQQNSDNFLHYISNVIGEM